MNFPRRLQLNPPSFNDLNVLLRKQHPDAIRSYQDCDMRVFKRTTVTSEWMGHTNADNYYGIFGVWYRANTGGSCFIKVQAD